MDCHYHPEREASEKCFSCNKPLCNQCAMPHSNGSFICNRCIAMEAAKDVTQGVHQRIEAKAIRTDKEGVKKEKKKKLRIMVMILVLLICIGIIAFQTPGIISSLDKNEKPIRNGSYETDAQTDQCIRNLWQIARILQEGGDPGNDIVCPASGKPFILKKEGDDVVARTPNPELYGFKDIKVSKMKPIPELIK